MRIDILIYEVPGREQGVKKLIELYEIEKLKKEISSKEGVIPRILYNPEVLEEFVFGLAIGHEADFIFEKLKRYKERVILLNINRDIFEYDGVARHFLGSISYLTERIKKKPKMYGLPAIVDKMNVKVLQRIQFRDSVELIHFGKENETTLGVLIVDYLKAAEKT